MSHETLTVHFKSTLTPQEVGMKVSALGGLVLRGLTFARNLYVVSVPEGSQATAAAALSADPECIFAEVNYKEYIGPRS